MSNINILTSFESGFGIVPSEKEVRKMLKENVSKVMFDNHRKLLSENGLGTFETINDIDRSIFVLFKRTYVDKNWHGCGDSKMLNVIRTQLPEIHQMMQYLSTLYIKRRSNSLHSEFSICKTYAWIFENSLCLDNMMLHTLKLVDGALLTKSHHRCYTNNVWVNYL